jgi:hypothetical protein
LPPSCEAVGFPESTVQHAAAGSPAARVRQSEHVVGTLLPTGQIKKPVNPVRPLPVGWRPLDVHTAKPELQEAWGGMSGAGVVLPDGRLVGLVVTAESEKQLGRLYVVPLADVLAAQPALVEALEAVSGRVVVEVRHAPVYRRLLYGSSLDAGGGPVIIQVDTELERSGRAKWG